MTRIVRYFIIAVIGFILVNSNLFAEEKNNEVIFKATITNASAKEKLETIVTMLKGVNEAEVNLERKELKVEYNPNLINTDMIIYTVKCLGFDLTVIEDKEKKDEDKKLSDTQN